MNSGVMIKIIVQKEVNKEQNTRIGMIKIKNKIKERIKSTHQRLLQITELRLNYYQVVALM